MLAKILDKNNEYVQIVKELILPSMQGIKLAILQMKHALSQTLDEHTFPSQKTLPNSMALNGSPRKVRRDVTCMVVINP